MNTTELAASADAYLLEQLVINPNATQTNFTALTSNYTLPGLVRNFTTDYALRIYTSGCYFFDYKTKVWSGKGCYVKTANKDMT